VDLQLPSGSDDMQGPNGSSVFLIPSGPHHRPVSAASRAEFSL